MKSLRERLGGTAVIGGGAISLAVVLLAVPILFAIGLSLLGINLDWYSWKTYVGLVVLWIAASIA